MGRLPVRGIDAELITRLKRHAAAHGRSAETEHREILRPALTEDAGHSGSERRVVSGADDVSVNRRRIPDAAAR